jgi:hypothetical protein
LGTHDLAARLITSSAGYGLLVERNEELDPLLVTVRGAWIVSTLNTAGGIAVYLASGTDELTLRDCVLVSNVTGTPAPASIDAAGPPNVRLYGTVMANLAKSANVTFITGATRFEVDSDVN